MRITEKELQDLGFREVSPGLYKQVSEEDVKKKVSSTYSHIKRVTVTIEDVEYNFRSEWEYIYAQYLQLLKDSKTILKWEYEPYRFIFDKIKRGSNSYLPDFKVYELDGSHWWAEVKGHMTRVAFTKLKRMAKYYPLEVVKLINKEAISEIKRKLGL